MHVQTYGRVTAENERYSTLLIFLHWTTAILVLEAYALRESARHFGKHPPITSSSSVLVSSQESAPFPAPMASSLGIAPPELFRDASSIEQCAKIGGRADFIRIKKQ